ncbi:hypothetical protein ABZ297_26885 [Nonomuraea sp. NPDC005983]|uniref:hypothetical protein n=1 Tax=Nonomuraea sp. NPDC005983 TaxID=3155595 RepID=UPI0033B69B40
MTLRRGLLALVLLSVMGAALELAAERHWQTVEQLIPWGALALLALALVVLAAGGSPKAVRALALAVLLVAMFGVYAHVSANYDAGLLDQRYAATWETLSPLTRWWYAVSKSVGAAPPLAPGMLAQSALLLLLTTLTRARVKEPAENAHTPEPLRNAR